MDDDSDKARRNLIAVSTVVIVIVFLGVESLSFAGLTVKFGFDSWRVWLVCYLFVAYFIFRYCLNPKFQENRSLNAESFSTDLDQVVVLFLIKIKNRFFARCFFKKVDMSLNGKGEEFVHYGDRHEYHKEDKNPQDSHYYYFLSRSFIRGKNNAMDYRLPVRIFWLTRTILKSYCFVFYGNGLWRFLETMLPFWLGLTALSLSSFRFFSIVL